MTTETSDFHKDQVLANKYRVISLLGKGGMGVVYKVEQIFLGKQLALKTIEQSELSDFTLSRFQAEARATFAVNHPNIIAVHDYGVLDGGIPFMAMELLEGETLGSFLERRTLKVAEFLEIFIQVCFGLAHAHDCGVVHRDIKPNNLMLMNKLSWDTEGSIKVLDFGIAKLTQHDGGEIQALTRTGEIFGSPFYMSPEQCSGGKIDRRSDVYSLGCVMFEALTGTPPFVGDSALNTMMMHQGSPTPSMKEAALGVEFSPELENIIQKMLAKKPEDRYQNLGQTAHDLASFKRNDFENISIVRAGATGNDAAKKIVMRKASYISLLSAVAVISSLSTAAAMYISIPKPEIVKPKEPIQLMSTGGVSTLDEYRDNLFNKHIDRGECRFAATELADDKSLANFKNYEKAQWLALGRSNVTDQGIAYLARSKPLLLDLKDCKSIKTVDYISALASIQNLNLSRTNITDDALPKLAKMPQLQNLQLAGCHLSTARVIDLAASNSLTTIELPDTPPLTNRQFAELQRKMPQCSFTNHREATLYRIMDGQQTLEALKRRYEHMRAINPDASTVALHMLAIAEKTYEQSAKTTKDKEARIAARKEAIEILEKTKNEASYAAELIAQADRNAELHRNNEAYLLAEQGAKACLNTIMNDEPKIIQQLQQAFWAAEKAGYAEKAMHFLEQALILAKTHINKEMKPFVGSLNEQIGWRYRNFNHFDKALPFLKDSLAFYEENKAQYPLEYARAHIELAHCTTDVAERKKLYNEGFEKIAALNYPEGCNLREHYCDGSLEMARIFNKEKNRKEALIYLKRGLSSAEKITNDTQIRKHYFENLIAEEERGKDV